MQINARHIYCTVPQVPSYCVPTVLPLHASVSKTKLQKLEQEQTLLSSFVDRDALGKMESNLTNVELITAIDKYCYKNTF